MGQTHPSTGPSKVYGGGGEFERKGHKLKKRRRRRNRNTLAGKRRQQVSNFYFFHARELSEQIQGGHHPNRERGREGHKSIQSLARPDGGLPSEHTDTVSRHKPAGETVLSPGAQKTQPGRSLTALTSRHGEGTEAIREDCKDYSP